ncbi:MAG: gliding motility-associated C-terminal domain-containing protein [Bacteroidetes bacterium]|nr:gliding motility-associated C-terminal domain-containing protein [Bacteroidota bacterium]
MPDSTVSSAGLFFDNSYGVWYTNFGLINCPANYRLNIHVSNVGEYILFGLKSPVGGLTYNLRKPNGTIVLTGLCPYAPYANGFIHYFQQAIIGPFPSNGGYTPLSYHVTSISDTGDYYFEITNLLSYEQEIFDLWDFQIVSGAHYPPLTSDTINGRVWSKSWQMYADLAEYRTFNAKVFVYSDDSIVTKLRFNNGRVGAVTIFCNQYGCLNTGVFTTDRMSMVTNTYNAFPGIAQYKVFLNNPDPLVYPNGVYGQVIGTPSMIPDPNYAICSGRKVIVLNVNKTGKLEIGISFPYGGSSTNVTLYSNVVPGINNIPWDGKDGTGTLVPDGTLITITIKYMNGLTNLPIWDQEQNPNGYFISLIRPVNTSGQVPSVYWDDTNLTGYNVCPSSSDLAGCVSGTSGCHSWWGNDCHDKMINTWWFGSSSTITFTSIFKSTPPLATGHDGSRCGPGTVTLHVTVLPHETADWYSSPVGGTPLLTGDTTFITPSISTTTTYYAVARSDSSICVSASRTAVVATIKPVPVPTITGPAGICAGASGVNYTTETGMSGYSWSISSGGIITGGTTTNTVTVTWNTAGAQTISVTYTNSSGCVSVPAIKTVTVNPLPVPTLSGPLAVCAGATGNIYFTEPGMSGYNWTISGGGIITSGNGTNSVIVTWNTVGTQTISVSYTNGNGCTSVPIVKNVIVSPLPAPAISGPVSVCIGSSGITYSSQAGMSAYIWSISAGGMITGGNGTNTITVTWISAGSQTVTLICTNGSGCTSPPAVINVLVYPLPVPTISGPLNTCVGNTGVIYTTEAGMSGYSWTISSGGIITGGSGTNSITVTWNNTGLQTISVSYTNGNGCTSVPTVKNITVNPLPVPTISGPIQVCAGTAGVLYVTEAGMSGYLWIISSGGMITNGTGTNTITVTWNNSGPQNITVVYTNSSGCTALPVTKSITVIPLPVPTITGSPGVCAGTIGVIYSTDAGMTNYTWTITAGGMITGGAGTNTIIVSWITAGNQIVSVSYTSSSGCTSIPAYKNVSVNPLPVPVITGPSSFCYTGQGSTYHTQSGMLNYLWSVSPGGSIIAGGGTNDSLITVIWYITGNQNLSVTYTTAFGCTAINPTVYNVLIFPLPVPTISGPELACEGSSGNVYTTEPGMTNYLWTVSSGGTINSGTGSNSISVTWNNTGMQNVTVNYTDPNNCTSPSPANYPVSVDHIPFPAGNIAGLSPVCAGVQGLTYSVPDIPYALSYLWSTPSGVTVVSGGNTSSITVNFAENASSGDFIVYGTNACGTGPPSPPLPVIVNHKPKASAGPDETVCEGTSVTIHQSNASNYQYLLWTSTGQGVLSGSTTLNPTYTPSVHDTGIVRLTLTAFAAPPCPDDSSSMTILYRQKPLVNAGPDQSVCGLIPVPMTGSSAIHCKSWNWITSGSGTFDDPGLLHPVYSPGNADLLAGQVILSITGSDEPCTLRTDSMILILNKTVTVDAGTDDSICEGEDYPVNSATALNFVSLTWSTSGSGTFSDLHILNPVYSPGSSDISDGFVMLTLSAIANTPCPVVSDSIRIRISKKPSADAGPDISICAGEGMVHISDAGALNYNAINWTNNGQGQLTGANTISPTYFPPPGESGEILLIMNVSGTGNCNSAMAGDQMKIVIQPSISILTNKADTIPYNSSDTLSAIISGGSGDYQYTWEPGSLLIDNSVSDPVTVTLTGDTLFILFIKDLVTGCTATGNVRVHITSHEITENCIVVYNVLTPNGDGANDRWIIDCIDNFPVNKVEIFNRWGDLITSISNYDNVTRVWNGEDKHGDIVPDGTYFYVITIKDAKTLTGWVFVRSGSK